jgi:hypothetical protein
MSKKVIEFSPTLSNNKTRKNTPKEKKVKPTTIITPNSLKSKFLDKIKEKKGKENAEKGLDSSVTGGGGGSATNELADSINYLSTLAKQQKQKQQEQMKAKVEIKQQQLQQKQHNQHNQTMRSPAIIIPHVELDLPDALKEVQLPIQSMQQDAAPILVLNSPKQFDNPGQYVQVSQPAVAVSGQTYSVDNAVPWGCLKGGQKPTYKTWNVTQKNRENISFNSVISTTSTDNLLSAGPSVVGDPVNISDRETKLKLLKDKMRQKQQQQEIIDNDIFTQQNLISAPSQQQIHGRSAELPISIDTMADSIVTSTNSPNTKIFNSNGDELDAVSALQYGGQNHIIKKTIKRKFNVGKSKKYPKVGILIKDKDTRKNILHAQRELKKHPINDVKKYLREHGMMKVGSSAPTDVVRRMYEASMLTGEVTNNNKDILLHNFLKEGDETPLL